MNLKQLFIYSIRNPQAVMPFIISLPNYFRLYMRLLRDSRVSIWLKAIFWAMVIYVISPLDFLPDYLIPVFGWTDDVIIFVAVARFFIKSCPQDVVMEHVAELSANE